jgi:predicted phosphodiesterase
MDLEEDVFEVVLGSSKYDISDKLDIALSTAEKLKYLVNNGEVSDVAEMSTDEQELTDKFIASQNKAKQRLQDNLRITRKTIRDDARVENAIEEHCSEIHKLLVDKPPHKWKHDLGEPLPDTDGVGVIQLSDLHMNELVEMEGNRYDFKVASKRLQYLAKRAKKRFKDENVSKVLIVGTGDFINSDRRIDELLNMATNRSKAEILTVMILEQFVLDIAEDFEVEVASITGNESRVRDKHSYSSAIATDNYDYTIFQILKLLFRDNDRITFIELDDPREGIINVNGHNLMIMHGDTIGQNTIHKTVAQIKSKMLSKYGVKVDYIVWGHIHSCYMSELFARSGSLVGANSYSDDALHLESVASQNIYIFKKNYIEPTMIDLQNPVDVVGYHIEDTLEAYNVKSASKAKSYNIYKSLARGLSK